MRRVIYFIVAFVIWMLVAWPFADGTLDLQITVAGIIASALAAIMFYEITPQKHRVLISPLRMFWLLVYLPVFFYYVLKANFDVVYRALHPRMPINPGIVKIKTKLKTQAGITALANSITLTPGTLTVDLTDDGDTASPETFLYIHWINVKADDIEQATKLIAQRFEWFLEKIFE